MSWLSLGCSTAPAVDSGLGRHSAAASGELRWEAGCRVADPAVLQDCVRVDFYREQLTQVAGVRVPGSRHWSEVQHRCDQTLTSLGFDVERHRYATGVNVVGTRLGTTQPEQRVLVGAHYDHIPYCPGADDNASGVAGVLELARVVSGAPHDRTLTVACWDEEEWGLIGSRAWAERARERDDEIVVYFNFDAIAYTDPRPDSQRVPPGFAAMFPELIAQLDERERRADFITIVADSQARPWAQTLASAADRAALPHALLTIPNWLRASHLAVDLERSDHASLWRYGYPAIMITDTAEYRSDTYHCRGRADTLDTLDVPFAASVVGATVHAVTVALKAPPPESTPAGSGPGRSTTAAAPSGEPHTG
ncbi:MAG: M28 family peptidase [Deltaproteobacteria bacterium]|nr:M28 family peptidase [Deltaproteobacteria bacterium]